MGGVEQIVMGLAIGLCLFMAFGIGANDVTCRTPASNASDDVTGGQLPAR